MEAVKMDKSQEQYEKMTRTPVHKLILRLAVPTILSMLATTLYNLVDTAFVGTLGNSASGAVGIVFGFMSILQAIGFMFGQGSGSLLSRRLGERNEEAASKTASTGFICSFVLGGIVAVICYIFIQPLVRILGSTETIAPYAVTYITYILATAPFVVSSFTLNNMLRYEGKAKLGMIGLITGGILNIGGDYLFMFIFNMGIAGAGLSTALSQVISFFILLSMFLKGKTLSKLSLKFFSPGNHVLSEIILIGFPSLLRQGLSSITTIMLNSQAAFYASDEGVAAMSIVNRIAFFLFAIALGIGQGFQPVSAFNFGAEKYKRQRDAYKFTMIISVLILTVFTVVTMIFSGNLIGLFRDDATVIEIGTRALRIQCIAQILMPICMVTEMLMQSSGQKTSAALLSALRGGLLFIPLIMILPHFRGMYGVEEAQPLSNILSIIPAVIIANRYFKKTPSEDRPD